MPAADIAIGSDADNIAYRLGVKIPDDTPEQLEFVFKRNHQGILKLFVSDAYIHIIKRLNENNPVFVAYMAGRFISENDSVLQNSVYTPSDYAAFENTFLRTIDYAATLAWFNNVDADEARSMRDSGQKTELPELKAVREALSKALLGQYERPRMRGTPPELMIYEKGTDRAYRISQLSDGYRAMLALVMDLARRMAQARGSDYPPYESLLNSPAIVLIDEVDIK